MKRPKATTKSKKIEPGFDGSKVYRTKIRISSTRAETRSVRARPGTFEWRYGRKTGDLALYHAGNHYAVLWEQAGTADARSPNYSGGGGAGWKGLPDKRCDAMSELKAAFQALGMGPTARLTDYCVKGLSTSEIAARHGVKERDMAPVLHQDLRDCAKHFRFV